MKIKLEEFVPPIVNRTAMFFNRMLVEKLHINNGILLHPFNKIPLKSNDVISIIDIGANHGAVTISALRSYPNAHIVCYEPVMKTFKSLTKNVHKYQDRVTLHNIALSDKPGKLKINLMSFDGANSIDTQSDYHKKYNPHVKKIGEESVEVKTLDDVYDGALIEPIDIVKIDVEGFELSVLKGGSAFFTERVKFVLIEIAFMRDGSIDDQEVYKIFSFFEKSGFSLINVIDLHPAPSESKDLRIAQMDCVFMNSKYIV